MVSVFIIFVPLILLFETVIAKPEDGGNQAPSSVDIYEKLKSKDYYTQIACLQYIVKHCDKIDGSKCVFDLMQIYKTGKNTKICLLVINVLEKMKNRTAIQVLQNQYYTQSNPVLQNAIWVALQKVKS
ncbi:MAG: hypothetical protein DWQ05_10915 [Calditrichaeota bacterium]|nr:MAG: hypothetical protein DWQ05_10915 [Calditrichota bacterium]